MQYDHSGRVRRRPLLHLVRLTVERRGQSYTHVSSLCIAGGEGGGRLGGGPGTLLCVCFVLRVRARVHLNQYRAGMVFKGGVLGQELQQGSHNLRNEHEPNVVLRHKHVHVDASGRQIACPVHGPKATCAARATSSTEA